ncbi:ras guanyl-nucleotide exchange factor [Ophiostoma piceae UAMH 11346]|uniref:Ras guanyl-nucleotide exchange factor n=1 Tax=Ophiostoma piceae (strain UAMH 11346) TaxID=1262450 RepID=S3CZA0_OPHP1|nr:ras guanyl-nucleotide exchange factor [Ophiostoma piceae UAMH 11346]
MAPPTSSRARTHTLPDDRALFLFGPLVRRKSAGTIPSSRRTASASLSSAPPIPTPPPGITSGSQGAPRIPSLHITTDFGSNLALQSQTAASAGPWSGTFLDAGPDPDGDSDDDVAFYDAPDAPQAPEITSDSEIGPTSSSSVPDLLTADKKQQSKQPHQHPTSLPPPVRSSNARDSFISILDDPFFQRYHPGSDWFSNDGPTAEPATPSLPPEPTFLSLTAPPSQPFQSFQSVYSQNSQTPRNNGAGTAADRNTSADGKASSPRHDSAPKSTWPLSLEPLSLKSPTGLTGGGLLRSLASPSSPMETVNIAVIGADGVGKSAFVQRALRLAKPPTQSITAIHLNVENRPFVVALIELDLEHFDVNPNQRINWPTNISGHIVPHIDGALMLYDVMNKDSIRDLPPTISALNISGLPTILVATKCDNPEPTRQINADAMATVFPSILSDFKTSVNVPNNTRDCLQTIVLAAVYNRQGAERFDSSASPGPVASSTSSTTSTSTTRRRAASSAAHLDTPPDSNNRPLSDQSTNRHSRASSELSLLRTGPSSSSADHRESIYRVQNSRSPRIEFPNSPVPATSFGAEMTDEHSSQSVHGMLRSSGVRIDASHDSSFLDTEESDAESLRYSMDIPILQRNDEIIFDKPAKAMGMTFDDLVDRLLLAPMSRADFNFQDVFLCLYRKFAAPNELLAAIIVRLDKTWDDKTTHFLERTATQFRYIEVIARWVSLYPGDFARPLSRRQLEALVYRLANEPIFTSSARHIQDHLENEVEEDDDTSWAKSDDPPEDDTATLVGMSNPLSPLGQGSDSLMSDSMRSLTLDDSRSSDHQHSEGGSNLALTHSGGHGSGKGASVSSSHGGPSSQVQFNSYDDYEREAATMEPMATLPLNKFRYHIFMDMDPSDIADEITRIDWIMFSSIRIRDLVRHVSLSVQEKSRCKSLKNMNRMISHFNHIARWVSNMILIRDKAKHRAPCLQKFMDIALRLRQLKNYNGLAAVLAGINGTSIHRLSQTRALVDADVQKRFARLVLLMSTQKSHFAYRLAWENSPLPRIPFMPLHRRDLVSAEEGSRTFVGPDGDRINWKKFEVLGEVLLPIMKSQGTPYPDLRKHQASREMILDCRMPMDEEEIYQRSVQVEPTGGSTDLKKKFSWLPK